MLKLYKNSSKNKLIYNKLALKIKAVLGDDIFIEHVGSTVLGNVDGKGIIDILVGLKDVTDLRLASDKLIKMGYFAGKNNNPADGYVFLASTQSETGKGDSHIHLALSNSQRFNDFLKIRDFFINNPEKAKEYSDLKHQISKTAKFQREDYKRIKSQYIESILHND